MYSGRKRFLALLLSCLALPAGAAAQTANRRAPDLTKEPTLYVVGYAHLDTQWRWEYPQVVNEYIPRTMRDNFAMFEKYPNYVFNFTGANRYRMMKEALDIPAGAKTLTLPDDGRVRVLAVTVSDEGEMVKPAQPLFDSLERDKP